MTTGGIEAYCPEGWTILHFGKKRQVRAAVFDGAVWFATDDVFNAGNRAREPQLLSRFAPEHRAEAVIMEGEEPAPIDVVSLVGALTIAAEVPGALSRILSQWITNRASELLTPPGGEPPHFPMTLLADGRVPMRPDPCSSQFFDWVELNAAHRSRTSPIARLREAQAAQHQQVN